MRHVTQLCLFIVGFTIACSAGASSLGDLAKSMAPGEWKKLPASFAPTTRDFWRHPLASEDITAYANRGEWDPVRRKMFFIGCGYGPAKLVVYDEATNTWTDYENIPSDLANIIHIWDHSAYDPVRGILYAQNHNGSSVFKLDVQSMTWSRLPALPQTGETRGTTYVPEIDSLVVVHPAVGAIYALKTGASSWTKLADSGYTTNYHPVAEYDSKRGVVYFGGGNSAPQKFFELQPSGVVKSLTNAPIDIDVGSGGGDYVTDPNSGHFLIRHHSSGQMAEYLPESNSWTMLPNRTPSDITGTPYSFATPISTHGVIMYVAINEGSSAAVWLYKHSPSTRVVDPPPAAPRGLRTR
jgi:hypothetical protein